MSIKPMLRFFDKPSGLTTHTSLSSEDRKRIEVDPVDSFLGHLSYRSEIELWPAHRLDRGTTGVLVATDTSEEAAELAKLFEAREVRKTYFFITDRNLESGSKTGAPIRVESFIDRGHGGRSSNFFSLDASSENPVNAITTFEFVRDHLDGSQTYALWCARPETGRPHQIRLHAESLGLSILGDTEHGGTAFPAMCLHAAEIKFSWRGQLVEASSPLPRWFNDLALLSGRSGERLVSWLNSIERRERLNRSLSKLEVAQSETERLIHSEGHDLRVDRLGNIIHLHWYGEEFDELDRDVVSELTKEMKWESWYLQIRSNRGRNPNHAEILTSHPDLQTRWQTREEAMTFTFRRDSGLSSGLFLDQRANRRDILKSAHDRRILNLFSYTGGFSVAAALAGAAKVVTVDLSKSFVAWSKENFQANGLDTTDPRFEFRSMEARDYLKWAEKKKLQFDLVICDPPSFARSDSGVLRIEKDFEMLLKLCADVVGPGGRLLFSTNYEGFTELEVFSRAQEFAAGYARPCTVRRAHSPDFDFEFPRENRAMKCFYLDIR